MQYVAAALDDLLGLVGGLAAIVAAFLQWSLGDYEVFRLQNSMIRHFYWTSPKLDKKRKEPETEHDAKQSLLQTVATRGKYWYNYSEFLLANFIRRFCCCCKNMECYGRKINRLQRHIDASKHLENELDIINIIKTHRLSNFLAKMQLHKQQRKLINSFRKYEVKQSDAKESNAEVNTEEESLVTGI